MQKTETFICNLKIAVFCFLHNKKPKYQICRDLKINIIIDDMPEIAEECSQKNNIVALVLSYPWNKNLKETEKIKRVDGWKGILKYFDNNQ